MLRNVGAARSGAPLLTDSDSRLMPDQRFEQHARAESRASRSAARPTNNSIAGQLVRLGFPLGARRAGDACRPRAERRVGQPRRRAAEAHRPRTPSAQVADVGQTALRALTTFDGAFQPAPPAATPLEVGGKLIPQWALVLLIGTLFFPLIVASIDAWARARRWRQVSQRGLLAPAIATVWLLLLGFLLRGVGLSGVIDAPPLRARSRAR